MKRPVAVDPMPAIRSILGMRTVATITDIRDQKRRQLIQDGYDTADEIRNHTYDAGTENLADMLSDLALEMERMMEEK